MAIIDKRVHRFAAFARKQLVFAVASVGNSQSLQVVRIVPYQGFPTGQPPYAIAGFIIESVAHFCTARVALANVEIQVNGVGASVQTGGSQPTVGAITLPGLLAPSLRKYKFTDYINLTVTTDGTGTLTNFMSLVTVRPYPMADEAA